MNRALRLHKIIGDNRNMSNESLERFVQYERNLPFIDRLRFKYYVGGDFSSNIFETLWEIIWW